MSVLIKASQWDSSWAAMAAGLLEVDVAQLRRGTPGWELQQKQSHFFGCSLRRRTEGNTNKGLLGKVIPHLRRAQILHGK